MSRLQEILQLGEYFFLIIPSAVLVLGAWLIGPGEQEQQIRRRLLLLLALAALALAALALLIWTNPYGREISSSLPALGMVPVLVALIVSILRKPGAIAHLWSTDKALLSGLALIIVILFGFLWLAEHTTFNLVVMLTAALAIAWLIGTRSGLTLMTMLSLASVGYLVYAGGGAFFTPGLDNPLWGGSTLRMVSWILMLLVIFLSAALLYGGLRGEGALDPGRFGKHLALAVLLIGGSAYPVFWDGIWSAAHARGFEDHLPFSHFLLSLAAGAVLAISLRGWRRLSGPAFVLLVTGVATAALAWGWNVSAFKLTGQRAARIDAAVGHFYQDNGGYPTDLAELTPRYLFYLPPPVVVRQGGWCYQGGADYYRLGYVSGQFTYFEADFQTEVYAQAGEPPSTRWKCEELVAKFETGELIY
jgi:hypothetical protein